MAFNAVLGVGRDPKGVNTISPYVLWDSAVDGGINFTSQTGELRNLTLEPNSLITNVTVLINPATTARSPAGAPSLTIRMNGQEIVRYSLSPDSNTTAGWIVNENIPINRFADWNSTVSFETTTASGNYTCTVNIVVYGAAL